MDHDRVRLARQFIASIPHCRELGIRLVLVDRGVAELALPYDDRLIGDPATEWQNVLREGEPFEGWQNYLPLIQRRTSSLLDLLDDPLLVVSDLPELLREAVELCLAAQRVLQGDSDSP